MFEPNAVYILQHIHFLIKIAHQRERAPYAYVITVHTHVRLFMFTLNVCLLFTPCSFSMAYRSIDTDRPSS